MLQVTKEVMAAVRSGAATEKELAEYLLLNFSVYELVGELAGYIINDVKPIPISQADFDAHFRIIGKRANGEEERRGRKGSH